MKLREARFFCIVMFSVLMNAERTEVAWLWQGDSEKKKKQENKTL